MTLPTPAMKKCQQAIEGPLEVVTAALMKTLRAVRLGELSFKTTTMPLFRIS